MGHPNPHKDKGYGMVQIPVEDRTVSGVAIKGDTILAILQFQAANPLASNGLISKTLGFGMGTIRIALNCPYAQKQKSDQLERLSMYATRLEEIQGDAVEFWGSSLQHGHKELENSSPNSALLTTASRSAETVSKATGLLSDSHLTVRHELASQRDYATDDLLPDSLASILVADAVVEDVPTDKGEGESP